MAWEGGDRDGVRVVSAGFCHHAATCYDALTADQPGGPSPESCRPLSDAPAFGGLREGAAAVQSNPTRKPLVLLRWGERARRENATLCRDASRPLAAWRMKT